MILQLQGFFSKSIKRKIFFIIGTLLFLSGFLVVVGTSIAHVENLLVILARMERQWLGNKLNGFSYYNKYVTTENKNDYTLAIKYLEKGLKIEQVGVQIHKMANGETVDTQSLISDFDAAFDICSYKESKDIVNLIGLIHFLPDVKILAREWKGAHSDSVKYLPAAYEYAKNSSSEALEKMYTFQTEFKVRGDIFSSTLGRLAHFAYSAGNIAFWAVLLFFSSLAVVVSIAIVKSITTPLHKITKTADLIAGGELEIPALNITTSDETGMLARSFEQMAAALKAKGSSLETVSNGDLTEEIILAGKNDSLGKALIKMRDAFKETLGKVNHSVETVSTSAKEISSASQSLAQGASEQAASLEQVSASITQINSQSIQNAASAKEANEHARQSKSSAEEGNTQMNEVVSAMNDITGSSEDIKKVVKVIDDIAFQINLLALNANVEAARAGKYGKGFAVVADEVRSLAVRSGQAVKETNEMVERSLNNVNTGSKRVKDTAQKLDEIINGAAKVVTLVDEITMASNEQATALGQIAEAIAEIDKVTQSNTASSEESAASSVNLAAQAEELRKMVAGFKLSTVQSIPAKELGQVTENILPAMVEIF